VTRQRLTLDEARHLDFGDLSARAYAILADYECSGAETPNELESRISRTLDELPDLYAWFLQLHAFFDHWTEWNANQHGMKALEYKEMRIKRDLMENVAKAAKLRYEATSRRLTQTMASQEETRMPRGR
jgi:hypothetical protein